MLGKATKQDGSKGLVKLKYSDEHGYVADMGKDLYHPENFSDVSVDTLSLYQQRHNDLYKWDFTAGC